MPRAQAKVHQGIIEADLATKRGIEELRKAMVQDLKEPELRLTVKLGAVMGEG